MFRLILRFSVRILMNKKHHECLRTLQHSQLIHSVAADQLREIAFPYLAPAIPIPPGFLNKGREIRLHGLAHPPALSATTRPAKPRSHSDSREVKALLVICLYGYVREASAFDRPRCLKSKIAPMAVPIAIPIARLGAMLPDDAPTAAPIAVPIATPTPIPFPDELLFGMLVFA